MNDFTKEELEKICQFFNIAIEDFKEPESTYKLRDKIQSMITDYCKHRTICSLNFKESSEKPPLGIIPRHFWFKNRIRDCILALQRLEDTENWDLYLRKSKELAIEIKYASEEWEKNYRDNQ